MSISYTSYIPLCDDGRHYMFIYPIGAVVLAHGLSVLDQANGWRRIAVAFFLVAQLLLATIKNYENTWYLYLPLITAIVFWPYLRAFRLRYVMVVAGLASVFVENAQYNRSTDYPSQKALAGFVFKQSRRPFIVTDAVYQRMGDFFTGYDSTRAVFLDYIVTVLRHSFQTPRHDVCN
ncbi:MAG: hypothetical protein NZM43_00340 [Saprospiraceae bacterium]|nr:hypothetical protein [Saprospiraceae bacterium]MDW8482749.1 hypothetical protein [Saprospiraceae bacterium]